MLTALPGRHAVSRLFATPAFPAGSGPDFVNAAVAVETDLPPEAILALLHEIEAETGRERRERWAARTLDLDLIALGDLMRPDRETLSHWIDLPLDQQMQQTPDRLLLPHPRMQDRAFVLVPLSEVVPAGWRHPLTGHSVDEMLTALPEAEKAGVRPLE